MKKNEYLKYILAAILCFILISVLFKDSFYPKIHPQNVVITKSYLTQNDITELDSLVLLGRAPGNCNRKKEYNVDKFVLSKDIKFLKEKYDVGTIIDLRTTRYEGYNYQKEKDAAQNLGINYVNIEMDASIVPTQDEINKFFETIENSNGKVYIHCHAGRDRTGIMASIYLAKTYKINEEEILEKVFDARNVERLKYMRNNPSECEKFSTVLKNLKNTSKQIAQKNVYIIR